jgi:antitoxin MazE
MKTKVIKIGNSQGIRLPKVILSQIGVEDELDLEVVNNRIILKPIRFARKNWRNAFKRMDKEKEDALLDGDDALHQSSWDDSEWTWDS